MPCTAKLNDGPLVCIRKDPHEKGHVFESSNGSDTNDRHTEGGHG